MGDLLNQKLKKHPDLAKRLDELLSEMVHARLYPRSDAGAEANEARIAELKAIFRKLNHVRSPQKKAA